MPDACSCEEIRTILQEFLSEIAAVCQASGKNKRKPSAYNIFMGKCVKGKSKDIPIQERFRQCAAEYRAQKKQEE